MVDFTAYLLFIEYKFFSNKKYIYSILFIYFISALLTLFTDNSLVPILLSTIILPILSILIFYHAFRNLYKVFLMLLFRTLAISLTWAIALDAKYLYHKFFLDQNYIYYSETTLKNAIPHLIVLSIIITTILLLDRKYVFLNLLAQVNRKHTLLATFLIIGACSIMIPHYLLPPPSVSLYIYTELLWYAYITFLFATIYFTHIKSNITAKLDILSMEYQKNLESIERTKEFKHDYRGLLMTLSVHLENNQTEEALNLLNKIKAYSRNNLPSQQVEYIQLINNIPIQSVLLTKLKLADELGIPIEIDCNNILLSSIDLFDFLRMFSILLDNAIEECKQQSAPFIKVYLKEFKDAVTLQVENSVSTDTLQIPLSKFTEKNYSTKGAHRGKGLFTLTKLAAKYTNVFVQLQVSSTEKIFQASLVVKKYH